MNTTQDERPLPFDFSPSELPSLIFVCTQNVRNAKTPEERAQAEASLVRMREQAKWRFVRELPPLFRLYQHDDGRWSAELSSELYAKNLALRAKTHTDKEKEVIAQAVNFMGAAGSASPGTATADAWAKVVYEALHGGLITRLHALMYADPESRMKLGEKLKKDLAHAIDQFVTPEGIKPRANATLVDASAYKVNATSILIEEAAIEGARLLAQQSQALPTKQSLRDWIEKHHPETRSLSPAKWSALWKKAGLETLPEASAWSR